MDPRFSSWIMAELFEHKLDFYTRQNCHLFKAIVTYRHAWQRFDRVESQIEKNI